MVLARDLHVFFMPSPDEVVWAREKTDTDEHLLALTLALKCFQKMGRFPKAAEVPEAVVEHVRRCLELDERVLPLEKLTQASLELPAFSTLDAMESKVRGEVNAQICKGIWVRLGPVGRARLAALLVVVGSDGKSDLLWCARSEARR